MTISTPIVSQEQWLKQRLLLLEEEKKFNKLRDELSRKRRELPRMLVDQDYQFQASDGQVQLSELFADNSQLIIYHFMYGADWEEGCPSCSFWADNFDGIDVHLSARDAAFAVISIAPVDILDTYKKRMGWKFNWVSSAKNTFNADFNVSSTQQQRDKGEATYNYKPSTFPGDEAPGISVFQRDPDGKIYHTYSTFSRGLDMLNGAYHYMDLLPKGRDEENLDFSMAWLKRNDAY